jgi:hypothetical protein
VVRNFLHGAPAIWANLSAACCLDFLSISLVVTWCDGIFMLFHGYCISIQKPSDPFLKWNIFNGRWLLSFSCSLSLSVKISVYVWRFSGMSNLEWLATVTMMDIDEQCVLELVPMRCGTHPMHQHLPFLCLSSPQLWVEQMESFQVCIGVPVNIEFSWVAKNVFEMSEHSGTEIEWNWLEGVCFSFCLAKCFPAQDVKIMKLVDHHGTV